MLLPEHVRFFQTPLVAPSAASVLLPSTSAWLLLPLSHQATNGTFPKTWGKAVAENLEIPQVLSRCFFQKIWFSYKILLYVAKNNAKKH